jgi:hypothetical protein
LFISKVWQDFPKLRKISQIYTRKPNASKKRFPISIDQQMIVNPQIYIIGNNTRTTVFDPTGNHANKL